MLLLLLLIGLYVFRSYWCPLCKGGLYTSNFFFRYRYELMIYFLDDDVGTFVLYSNYGSYDVEKVLMNVFGNNDYVGIENEQYLREISESEAQAGDVIIVNKGGGAGSNGHTGILTEKWKGYDTKIIQEGGNGDRVNIEAFGTSFTSLISGGDICFARPVKK